MSGGAASRPAAGSQTYTPRPPEFGPGEKPPPPERAEIPTAIRSPARLSDADLIVPPSWEPDTDDPIGSPVCKSQSRTRPESTDLSIETPPFPPNDTLAVSTVSMR